ncbi:TPA: hypothetical protein U5D21_003601 [Yersinia enterocolitica]|nr:hypothetical protein [Yersinia enterocolitica]
MANPKLKVDERYEELMGKLLRREPIDEMTFRIIRNEIGNASSPTEFVTLGLAYLTFSKHEEAMAIFDKGLLLNDIHFARTYCHILHLIGDIKRLDEIIYSFADIYKTKWFSFNAASSAYLVGKISLCNKYLDMHIKMLSEEENRDSAVKFQQEILEDMSSTYVESGCTQEQYQIVGTIVHRILGQYHIGSTRTEISGKAGGSYVIEVHSSLAVTPKLIAEMNRELADAICMDERLDDCKLIARFSANRNQSTGASYAYN